MKPVPAFTFLRAMARVRSRDALALPRKPERLSDPLGDAIVHGLIEAALWSDDGQLTLEHHGRRLYARIFLPGKLQTEREAEKARAIAAREAAVKSLRGAGCAVRFADVLECGRGRKGWEVVIRAEARG